MSTLTPTRVNTDATTTDPDAASQRLAVSVTEAAQLLDISRPTLYKLIEAGEIRASRFGTKIVRIPLEDVYALLGLDYVDPTTV